MLAVEERVSILLKLLGDDLADAILGDLAPDRVRAIRLQLAELDPDFLEHEEVDNVLDEFERILRFALDRASSVPTKASSAASLPDEVEEDPEDAFVSSGHLRRDLNRVAPVRLAAVFEREHPTTCALVIQAMDMSRAGEVLDMLKPEQREAIFQVLTSPPPARRELLDRLLQTTIDQALNVDLKALQEQNASVDQKLAAILRAMNRKSRFELLSRLAEEDADTASRIRDLLYTIEDIGKLEGRTIQKMLGRIDTTSLAKAIKQVAPAIKEKILQNLSKRAVAALEEEMEFSGAIEEDAEKQARLQIVRIMMELDEKGELTFEK